MLAQNLRTPFRFFKFLTQLFVVLLLLPCLGWTENSSENSSEKEEEGEVEKIAIIGTRTAPRSVLDSSVPMDIIFTDQLARQGTSDMTNMIKNLVPSYNVNDFPIHAAATLIRPASLRGLSSDHTLILVNGKRRHRASIISFHGDGLSNGAQGPDISTIPAIALRQVEVLRDGAAAQYGADAIAGAINFVLRENDHGGDVEIKTGSYYAGDGQSLQFAGNIGLPLTDSGFANLSLEYRTAEATSRSVQRNDAAALIAAGNTHVRDVVQIWGAPQVDGDIKFFMNSGIELNSQMKTYLFGNYSRRRVEGGFYFRNPHTRNGVFDGGKDSSGDRLLLVGDVNDNGIDDCPSVVVGDNVLDSDTYQNDIANNDDCWAFNKRFPGGFTPQFGGVLQDYSVVAGLKGKTQNQLRYDISASWGNNRVDHFIYDTVNASLGEDTPTSFDPSSYVQDEKSVNLDLVKTFDNVWGLQDLSVAGGLEYRYEFFNAIAGDEESYIVGPLADQGFSVGSNGFSGLHKKYESDEGRSSAAIYLDTEGHPTDDLLLTLALRHENFSDFGDATIGKVSTHYRLNDQWALRGAVATGFKSPTIGQSTLRNVSTGFARSEDDNTPRLVDRVTLPASDPIAQLKGASELKPETSNHFNIGAVSQLSSNVFLTFDYFRINVKDRISLTSGISLTEEDRASLISRGIEEAKTINEVIYFTNDFSTQTQGLDIVASYDANLFHGSKTKFLFTFNWTETKVKKVRSFDFDGDGVKETNNINEPRIKMIEGNLPKFRYSLAADHAYNNWQVLTRLNYFSSIFEDHTTSYVYPIENVSEEYTVDLEIGYKFDDFVFVVGAQNLFDERPDENPYRGITGARYPITSPISMNGGFYYTQLTYSF